MPSKVKEVSLPTTKLYSWCGKWPYGKKLDNVCPFPGCYHADSSCNWCHQHRIAAPESWFKFVEWQEVAKFIYMCVRCNAELNHVYLTYCIYYAAYLCLVTSSGASKQGQHKCRELVLLRPIRSILVKLGNFVKLLQLNIFNNVILDIIILKVRTKRITSISFALPNGEKKLRFSMTHIIVGSFIVKT